MDRKPNKWLKGLAASSLAVGAFFALASPAWAAVEANGLTVSGANVTGNTVATNDGITLNAGAGNVTLSGNTTGNVTLTLASGYTGTVTFNGVSTGSGSNTLNVTVSSSAANLAFSGTNNINVGSTDGFLKGTSNEPDVPVNITVSGTTTISGSPSKSILGAGAGSSGRGNTKSGYLNITGDGTLTLQNSANDGAIWVGAPATSNASQQAGSITIGGNVTVNADASWTGTGGGATSQAGYGVQSNGAFTVGPNATLVAKGGAGNEGIYLSGGSATFEGNVTSTGGGPGSSGSGTMNHTGAGIAVGNGAQTATLKNSGTLTVTGGAATAAFTGTGKTVRAGLEVKANATVELGGTVIATGGAVPSSTSGGVATGNGITINSGASVTLNGDITATGGGATTKNGAPSSTGNGIAAYSSFTVEGGTLTATGGPDAQSWNGFGIYVNNKCDFIAEGGTITATSGTFAPTGSMGNTGSSAAGIGLNGGNLLVTGAEVTATGANSTGPLNPGGIGITASSNANIYVKGGSLTATGGNGSGNGVNSGGTRYNAWAGCGLLVAGDSTSTSTLSVENYDGETGSGPTVTIQAGEVVRDPGSLINAIWLMNYNSGNTLVTNKLNLDLYTGTTTTTQNAPQDVFYPWLVLTGSDTADAVQGFAGMTMPQDQISVCGTGNAVSATSNTPKSVVVIEPAELTALDLGFDKPYATTGTTLTPTITEGEFEGMAEPVTLADGLVSLGEIQDGEGYTPAKGQVTVSADAQGNELTVSAAAPESVTELYDTLTTVSGNIAMTYPITLNADGGTFPLYQDSDALRPVSYSTYTLWTQPGKGMLLPFETSEQVAKAAPQFTGDDVPALENLTSALGALPEATTTDTQNPYFQGWFTESEGGSAAAQPFESAQTIYAQFGDTPLVQEVTIYRLYNPYSYEHLYTAEESEYNGLIDDGWEDEGIGWIAPEESDTPVYRLFNPYSQDHYYCTSKEEADHLVSLGWKYDFNQGAAFYSATQTAAPIYQLFNPYEQTNTHLWTGDFNEYTVSQERGWEGNGISWYALSLN